MWFETNVLLLLLYTLKKFKVTIEAYVCVWEFKQSVLKLEIEITYFMEIRADSHWSRSIRTIILLLNFHCNKLALKLFVGVAEL